ncbi:TnsD family Tn7-like transposition protein [Aquibacillus sp. 3ASR75-11]|uniref:TnsD family Tn7-like transposition protein n=1 Tax=Terrihalobacillus insolitus TaxID=2950438 RepID=A0A9X4ALK3_9BACI|nr:TnsD family Tn7-like transposition protein [Terrihalobacillus insolitus]MDC3424331.1 TnsD family Tn7-like transposition protein [Terrihalobacillus insolitus]
MIWREINVYHTLFIKLNSKATPIRHLLFISFLGEKVDSFYQFASESYQPFGKGPYLCLNAAAEHYFNPVIPTVKVTICTDTRRPVGTFTCSCGFSYSRRGPDQTEEDPYRIGRIKQFGPVWQDKLSYLLHVEKLSYYAAAKHLKVDIGTVKKYAGLKAKTLSNYSEPTDLLERKQDQWLQLCKDSPNLTTSKLRKQEPALYAWLYRHDKQWLHKYSPKTRRNQTTNTRVDWRERDRELLRDIEVIVRKLLGASKPIRLTIGRIGKEVRLLPLLEQHLDKLSLTRRYLQDVTETTEQFQIRRVKWAVKELLHQHQEVVDWRIRRLAGLKDTISDSVSKEIIKQVKQYRSKV